MFGPPIAQGTGASGPVILFVIGALVVGAIAYWNHRTRKARMAAFRALATARGMTYSAEDADALLSLPFELLRRGDGRGIENVLHGALEGMTMHVFDYWYYEESTDAKGKRSRTTYRFDCVVTTYGARGAALTIDEENLFTRIADAVALDDLQFESEEFNRTFNVKGDDERFATAFLDARMMQWLLQHGRDHAFETAGERVLVSHRQVEVAEIPTLMDTAAAFVGQIPAVVPSLYPKSG